MQSCSKAPWGLLVLAWSDGIFTANARSPWPSPRQCPHDYSIRAGLNLPDKEFRYLRTIIVIAAVHRGFSSNRKALPLTFRHRAGVSPYTSAFALAETYVFGKQFRGLFCCGLRIVWYEFATFQAKPFDLSISVKKFKILIYTINLNLIAWNTTRIEWCGGRPYPEVTVAVLPSSLAKGLS